MQEKIAKDSRETKSEKLPISKKALTATFDEFIKFWTIWKQLRSLGRHEWLWNMQIYVHTILDQILHGTEAY